MSEIYHLDCDAYEQLVIMMMLATVTPQTSRPESVSEANATSRDVMRGLGFSAISNRELFFSQLRPDPAEIFVLRLYY